MALHGEITDFLGALGSKNGSAEIARTFALSALPSSVDEYREDGVLVKYLSANDAGAGADRDEVRAVMGQEPERTGGAFDRWQVGERFVHFEFAGPGGTLSLISLMTEAHDAHDRAHRRSLAPPSVTAPRLDERERPASEGSGAGLSALGVRRPRASAPARTRASCAPR